MEGVGLFQEITGGGQTKFGYDVVVVLRAVRPTRSGPSQRHVLTLEVSVALFAEMHIGREFWPCMSGSLIDIENSLRCDFGARGIGTICRRKIIALKFVPGPVGIGKSGCGERRITPSLKTVVFIERGLPMTNQMQMQNHGSHATAVR